MVKVHGGCYSWCLSYMVMEYSWRIHPWEPENQPLEVWRFLLETIIFRFHVKLWGCSDLYERKEAMDTAGELSWSLPQLHWRINLSSTRFSLEDEMVSTPQKRDTIREIECLDILCCKNSDMEPENGHFGERENIYKPSIWRFQPLIFCGVFFVCQGHISMWREPPAVLQGCFFSCEAYQPMAMRRCRPRVLWKEENARVERWSLVAVGFNIHVFGAR